MIDRPALIAWRSKAPWPNPYTQALAKIAEGVGLTVSSRQRSGQMVHVYFDAQPTEGIGRIRIKIEMNIAETASFLPRTTIRHAVQTSWWSGETDIPTFQPSELLATKLRALYQRSKGRDLFDLWLGLTILKADPVQIVAGYNHYMRDATFSFPELRDNLAAKLATTSFRGDLDALTTIRTPCCALQRWDLRVHCLSATVVQTTTIQAPATEEELDAVGFDVVVARVHRHVTRRPDLAFGVRARDDLYRSLDDVARIPPHDGNV